MSRYEICQVTVVTTEVMMSSDEICQVTVMKEDAMMSTSNGYEWCMWECENVLLGCYG